MHSSLILYWIRTAALLITPLAPHFAEHIWSSILKEPKSIQYALYPKPSTEVDQSLIDAGLYMRGTVKTIRDAEGALLKMLNKVKGKKGGAGAAGASGGESKIFDPKKPKAVRIFVATSFPEWQDTCVGIVKEAYNEGEDKVDDVKVRELLTQKGLIKDKRAMPFIQAFKVCLPLSFPSSWLSTYPSPTQ